MCQNHQQKNFWVWLSFGEDGRKHENGTKMDALGSLRTDSWAILGWTKNKFDVFMVILNSSGY